MSIGLGVTTMAVSAGNVNLNQAENTVLLTVHAAKPIQVHRFGVVAEAAEGLLAASRIKLRRVTGGGATATDIEGTTLNPGGDVARGISVYKDMVDSVVINAGEHLTVAVSVAAGATSTGRLFVEYQELPFNGSNIPATAIKSE